MTRTFSRRVCGALLAGFIAVTVTVLAPAPPAAAATGLFSKVDGFATKTGFRGVVAWQANSAVQAEVLVGTASNALTTVVPAVNSSVDEAGFAVFDGLERGRTYYYKVRDVLTGKTSSVKSFKATNAYTAWDSTARKYTLNLLVQLDAQSLPAGVPWDQAVADISQGISIFAERLYDATDGFARLGKVLVVDENLTGLNFPNPATLVGLRPPACAPGVGGNAADVIVQSTQPFDSHTWGGWAIDQACTSFTIGRIGQLVLPWLDDLHMGYVSTHEMLHYAFNAPDLYTPANAAAGIDDGCQNSTYDISLMDNSGGWDAENGNWFYSELDRENGDRLCTMFGKGNTWDTLRQRYVNVPDRTSEEIVDDGDTRARGNDDGGALDIMILDRTPATSTLTSFQPDDDRPWWTCTTKGKQVYDQTGDALVPGLKSLDLVSGRLRTTLSNGKLNNVIFEIEVDDLQLDDGGNVPTGEQWSFNFNVGGTQLFTTATRYGPEDPNGDFTDYSLSKTEVDPNTGVTNQVDLLDETDGITGSISESSNRISVVVPAAVYNALPEPDFVVGDPVTGLVIEASRIASTPATGGAVFAPDDTADNACEYRLAQEWARPPVTGADTLVVDQDSPATTVNVLGNDRDPEGSALSVVAVSNPPHGTAVLAGGVVTYAPDAGYVGSDSFTYTVSDGTWTSTGTVSVTVNKVNRAPVANDDTLTVAMNGVGAIEVVLNDSDPDGDTLTVIAVSTPEHGTAGISAGGTSIAYAPESGFIGTEVLTYTVADDDGATDTATLTITVT